MLEHANWRAVSRRREIWSVELGKLEGEMKEEYFVKPNQQQNELSLYVSRAVPVSRLDHVCNIAGHLARKRIVNLLKLLFTRPIEFPATVDTFQACMFCNTQETFTTWVNEAWVFNQRRSLFLFIKLCMLTSWYVWFKMSSRFSY